MRNAGRDSLVQFYKRQYKGEAQSSMKALHSCEFLKDFLLLFKVLLNLPLTGCNQLNGGLRYTKTFMSGMEVCLLYHACQSVPPILPDPISRMSFFKKILVKSNPKGMDPNK